VSDLINPSAYGVLPTGFTRMRLPEIRQLIIDNLQVNTGLLLKRAQIVSLDNSLIRLQSVKQRFGN
jgi:hypothetical protein